MKTALSLLLFCLLPGCGTSFQNFNKQKFTRLSDLKNSDIKIENQKSAVADEFLEFPSLTGDIDCKVYSNTEKDDAEQIPLSAGPVEIRRQTPKSFINHKFPFIERSKSGQTNTLQIDPIITDRNSYNWFFFIGLSIFILTILNYIFVFLKKTRGKDFFLWAASIGLLTTWIMSWGLIKGSSNVTVEDRDNGYKAMLILAKIVAVTGIVVLVFLLTLLTVLIVISLK